MFVKNIYKNYGSNIKILEYKKGVYIEPPTCKSHNLVNCGVCFPRKAHGEILDSSIIRTKTTITDYVLTNEFEYFCTFTFDPKKVDSMNIEFSKDKMSKWLNNQRRDSPDLGYLIIAEKHKSGAIHFHALLKHYNAPLHFSGVFQKGRKVLNIQKWKYGFSTAIAIDNNEAVAYYIQKYITKDMLKISNKKRYWCSRNLKKPTKLYNVDIAGAHLMYPNLVMAIDVDYFTIYKTINY